MSRLLFTVVLFAYTISLVWSQNHRYCYDENGESDCYYWHMSGLCTEPSYRQEMYRMCRKTCNLCPNIFVRPYAIPTKKVPLNACRDTQTSCPRWKRYCKPGNQYYNFMMKHCKRVCFQCADPACKDLNIRCTRYKKYGYCQHDHKYFNYMKRNCAAKCNLCTADASKVLKNDAKPTKRPVIKKAFPCDFEEHECDWINQVFGDSGDWMTGVGAYGPTRGYNGSQNYLYVKNPHQGYKTTLLLPWQLVLPDGRKSLGTMCFHFMYQISHGRLSIFEVENPSIKWTQPSPQNLFESIDYKLEWTQARVNVRADPQYSLQVISQKGVRDSYIALDNFYFTKGKCSRS